ncbi:glycosyltransferase family 4 protein [Roseomonas sp. SSH11]|uniref:Glycosyltransferase family 4 protein n=1 Tax=Pararoseomonas baculiformis TaxID=2820812 RepID=A0ABS4A8J4_9PROT|nr:glycosyltransferase family 4 protein [Pararoseomonas baculiformis]MBP0443315.1 glycosyltransferase family 4 protein [Pararoseomonas baculiformis]
MRVLFVANVDFALRHFLLPLMRGARARGHEVLAACADGPLLDAPRAEGFTVIPVPVARSLSPRANWRALRALRQVIRETRPDLVHAHFPISGLLARLAARMGGRSRTAYTVHGFLFNQPGPPWRRGLSLALEWLGGRMTDTFLTVSEEEAGDARRLRIHGNPVAVRNGRDPARFRPDPEARAAIRAELGAAPDEVVVTAVSRLVRHKGYPELLRAMESVPGATLWVVGERLASDHGADLEPDFARAAALLGPRLRRLGYRHDTERVLAASDIFCLPSHFEGLPMSVIEAMLTGLPVVATRIGGPREQVLDGETGLLVPPGTVEPLAAALNTLAGDAKLRARMGEAGRARALDLYDEKRVVERTLDLLGL